jgi:hypothetical protein
MTAAAKVASQFIAFMHRSRQFVQKVSPLASWLGKKVFYMITEGLTEQDL